jgi:RHS repeat-associated protein
VDFAHQAPHHRCARQRVSANQARRQPSGQLCLQPVWANGDKRGGELGLGGSSLNAIEANASLYTAREYEGTNLGTVALGANQNAQTASQGELYYYRARYYEPVLKRFISEDPIRLAGGMNVYGYVGGDPASYVDYDGLNPQPPLQIIHSDKTLNTGSNKFSTDYWKQQPTDKIVESLKPKPGNDAALKVKPDGRVFDGNTRVRELQKRGFDVNKLPRERGFFSPKFLGTCMLFFTLLLEPANSCDDPCLCGELCR